MPTANAEDWIRSEGGIGKVSLSCVIGYLQIDTGPRRWPSACSEDIRRKKSARPETKFLPAMVSADAAPVRGKLAGDTDETTGASMTKTAAPPAGSAVTSRRPANRPSCVI